MLFQKTMTEEDYCKKMLHTLESINKHLESINDYVNYKKKEELGKVANYKKLPDPTMGFKELSKANRFESLFNQIQE